MPAWPGDPCGAVRFLPFYTVSLSVPLFLGGRAQASCFQNSRLFFWQMNSRSKEFLLKGKRVLPGEEG